MLKFRAWDKENLRMVNVYILNLMKRGNTGKYANLSEGWTDEFPSGVQFDLNNAELLQFISLSDKNGKEIYEGDYLEDHRGFQYEVKIVQGGFAINTFANEFGKKWTLWTATSDMQASGFIKESCEIIGNKFEGVK